MATSLRYQRVLIKLSGEALANNKDALSTERVSKLVQEIHSLVQKGVQVAIVIGGGNIIRGTSITSDHFHQTSADQMGMLATVINGIALRESFAQNDIQCQLLTAKQIPGVSEGFERFSAVETIAAGKVLILAGGTGNPLVTTDTAAVMRAIQLQADVVLKATKVNGVFDADPMIDANATQFSNLTYDEVLDKKLAVMDLTAILLAKQNELPIQVFNIFEEDNLQKAIEGQNPGTIIQ